MELKIGNEEFKQALKLALQDPEICELIKEHIAKRCLTAPWRPYYNPGSIKKPWER